MGKEIIWNNINWTEGDDFLAFAFGDFVSSNEGIIRTSDGDRYNINLVPPMQDKTADVPGGDGQYYFGTTHKPKVFNISFAFDNLTKEGLRKLKQTFAGKEMREFCLSEESDKIYMVKVTSQPSIKALCFFDGDDERYRGEGSVQFTAYWPYGRDAKYVDNTIESSMDKGMKIPLERNNTTTEVSLSNIGDIPAHFVFEAQEETKISKLVFGSGDSAVTIEGENITYWNSKTGIIKSEDKIISYSGDGLYNIPVNGITLTITHLSSSATRNIYIKYYNWYY